MKKYLIKRENKDFIRVISTYNTKGSRKKMIVVDKKGEKAFFKYQGDGYLVSEACSEKMCYEIAKVLNYPCAKIELGKDVSGTLGVLNYLFIQNDTVEHIDAVAYLNINEKERPFFYTISNIKKTLDNLDEDLFENFIKIMIFDALVGEQDRHEENWGIEFINNKYKISPLYDNGCSLLKEFKNETFSKKFYDGEKNFKAYIMRSKTLIYKEDNEHQYKHFEMIEYLNQKYSNIVQKELKKLNKLTNKNIETIVKKIPDGLISQIHKQYIIEYLKIRRDILLGMLK